ncbi:MAG: hypothetical protein HY894_04585 [Deltaproteobacteria bacterium]|nr:hypothetical protein [Deltaproteobacteria bacterium]
MRDENKIRHLSVIAVAVFVVIDSIIDPRADEISFLDMLITAGSHHELFMRLMVVMLMLFLGIISARFIGKRRRAEEEKERLIGELKDALGKVETLTGLLPICAYCKKVRDDQGYWNRIETYISRHSKAEFTHSICPECGKRVMDEFNRPPL